MTSYMSLNIPNPFGEWVYRRPYIIQQHSYTTVQDDLPGPSLSSPLSTSRPRDSSPSSHLANSSLPIESICHDENKSPSPPSTAQPSVGKRPVSLQAASQQLTSPEPLHPKRLLSQAIEHTVAALATDGSSGTTDIESSVDTSSEIRHSIDVCSDIESTTKGVEEESQQVERAQNLESTLIALEGSVEDSELLHHTVKISQDDQNPSQFRRWADSFRRKRPRLIEPILPPSSFEDDGNSCEQPHGSCGPNPPCTYMGRFKRNSASSSAFVETVKTASLSAMSLSIAGRSNGASHVSESRGHRGSHLSTSAPRFSTDSDRPSYIAAIDEAASQRGQKRRQILNEIWSSERGYVSDLRALANV